MMSTVLQPKPFAVEIKGREGEFELNKEVMKSIMSCESPRIIVVYGVTRGGKSAIGDQLSLGKSDGISCVKQGPFKTDESNTSCTKGCDVVGPIKLKEMNRNFGIDDAYCPDQDVFIIDTEGLSSMDSVGDGFIPQFLTVLQVADVAVLVHKKILEMGSIGSVLSNIKLSTIVSKSLNSQYDKCDNIIFCNGIEYTIENGEDGLAKYIASSEAMKNKIRRSKSISSEDKNLLRDVEIIESSPYVPDAEISTKSDKLQLYWSNMKRLVISINSSVTRRTQRGGKHLCGMIELLFSAFRTLKEFPKNPTMTETLTAVAKASFTKYTTEKFAAMSESMLSEIDSQSSGESDAAIDKCCRFIEDNEYSADEMKKCITGELRDMYEELIPDYVEGFIERNMHALQDSIKDKMREHVDRIVQQAVSDKNIATVLKPTIKRMEAYTYRDDIPASLLGDSSIESMWEKEESRHSKCFAYFRKSDMTSYTTTRENFINKVKVKFNDEKQRKPMRPAPPPPQAVQATPVVTAAQQTQQAQACISNGNNSANSGQSVLEKLQNFAECAKAVCGLVTTVAPIATGIYNWFSSSDEKSDDEESDDKKSDDKNDKS